MFELSLKKIRKRIFKSRPSVSAQPTKRLSKTEKFSLHFLIFSRAFFSFKRKRKFFCFDILLTAEWRRRFPPQALLRRAGGAEGRGLGGIPPRLFPLLFRRRFWAYFAKRNAPLEKELCLPRPPVRTQQDNSQILFD